METNNTNTNGVTGEKSADTTSTGEITIEQFKNALENNIECKGYFDSLCDKTVNTRLDKGIESWKEKNLNNLIETEINKRYPQKSETEIALEKAQEEKRQLQLQLQYQSLMAENKLPLEVLDFVAGKDTETTIKNIEKFKGFVENMAQGIADKKVLEKLGAGAYTPPTSPKNFSNSGSMWDI